MFAATSMDRRDFPHLSRNLTTMQSPHNLALFALTALCAVGALLMADAADAALRNVAVVKRRRAALLAPSSRMPTWVRPATLHFVSLGFLSGMAVSEAALVRAFS